MKLSTQNNSILLKNQTLLSDMTHKQSKTHTHTHTLQHSFTHWWDKFKTILQKPVISVVLPKCFIPQFNVQTTTKIIILPQHPVFGLGQAKEPLQHHKLYWPWPGSGGKIFSHAWCPCSHKIGKMLSHVVSITVHSVSVTWCKLWQQFGWQLLYWNAEGCTSYVRHISISKVQIYTLLYVGYWLITFILLLVVWQKKYTLQCHCEIEKKNKYVHKGENKNEKLSCCPLSIYAFQLKFHEMYLWAISENWFVIGWSIFSSLVKVKIHLNNSWQIY